MQNFIPISLSISAQNLPNKDTFSKSDPFCMVCEFDEEIGKTETIQNCLNPKFTKEIAVKFYFEKLQIMKFNIYDDDGTKSQLMGTMQIALSELMSSPSIERPLVVGKKEKGTITIVGRQVQAFRPGLVNMTISGVQLDKKDTFSSDPYLVIYDKSNNVKLYTTEVIKKNINPTWLPCQFNSSEVLRIECFDFDAHSKHDLIGTCDIPTSTLKDGYEIELTSTKGKKAGILKFKGKISTRYSFLDFIQNGTQLSFSIAIDFTGSNGNPKERTSLHYIGDSNRMTSYEYAISSIGGVLEYYDADRAFPVYGFGAKINGKLNNCFSLNEQENPDIKGIQSILETYRRRVMTIDLFGPTVFLIYVEFCSNYSKSYFYG